MTAEIVLKIAKVLAPVLIGAVIGGAIVGKVQQIRIDTQAVELTKVRQELTTKQKELTDCQEANATSQATIGSMKAELQSVQASCTTRLRQKERTAAEIRRIDDLKPGVKTDENRSNAMDSGDPVLDGLNRMYPDEGKPADRKD
jgi:septal ring factor EnvC (AmiA/AmiB activator)